MKEELAKEMPTKAMRNWKSNYHNNGNKRQ